MVSKKILITSGAVYGLLDDNKLVGNRIRGIWATRFAQWLAWRGHDVMLLVADIQKAEVHHLLAERDPVPRLGDSMRSPNRSVVRLVTMTVQRAHEIGIEPGLTQTHLEATQAVMQALSVIGDKHHVSDQLSIEDTISGDWALILSETLRTVTLNELLPSRPNSWNTPNLQNVPRQTTKPVNFAMQSSAADLSNVPKKLTADVVAEVMKGFDKLCLGCAYPTVARHHSDCAKRQPEPPKASECT